MSFKEIIQKSWQKFLQLIDLSKYIDVEAASLSIRDNVAFRGPNIVILFCAIIIASLGLNVNSIPVIIGAMLISPLMSPIVGFGLGLGINDTDLIKYALKHLGIMVGISILASTLFFLVSPLDMEHPTELLARTNPTIYDVLIALFGGFAGILEVSRKEKGTVMSGVAIATALMPPLCTVGYGIASWQWHFVLGAAYLFFINCIFISLASYIGSKFLGYPIIQLRDPIVQRRRKGMITLLLIVLLIPSIISAFRVVKENRMARAMNALVEENKSIGKSYIYDYQLHFDTKPATIELFIAGEELTPNDYDQLYRAAEDHHLMRTQLVFHQDAAYGKNQLSDRDIVQEIMRSNDAKLQQAEQENEQLKAQMEQLQQQLSSQQLPTRQLMQELQTQYAVIRKIDLGRMESSGVIMVVYTNEQELTNAQIQSINKWLKIRLHVSDAIVVQKNVD